MWDSSQAQVMESELHCKSTYAVLTHGDVRLDMMVQSSSQLCTGLDFEHVKTSELAECSSVRIDLISGSCHQHTPRFNLF